MQKMFKNTSSSTLFLWAMLFFVLFAPDTARADLMGCINGKLASDEGLSIFAKLACKAVTTLSDLRKIIYVLSGFGLIAFAFAAIFNKISFRHLANIGLSLFILSMLTPFIEYFTQKPGVELKYGKYLNPNYSAFDYSIMDTKGLEFTIEPKDMRKGKTASKDMQKGIEGKDNLFEEHEGYIAKPKTAEDAKSGKALRDYADINPESSFDKEVYDKDFEGLYKDLYSGYNPNPESVEDVRSGDALFDAEMYAEYDPEGKDPKAGPSIRKYSNVASNPLFNPNLYGAYKPDGKNVVGTDLSTLAPPEDTRTGWQKLKDTVKDVTAEGVKAYNAGATVISSTQSIKNTGELLAQQISGAIKGGNPAEILEAISGASNATGSITDRLTGIGNTIGGNYTDKEGKPGLGSKMNDLFSGVNNVAKETKEMNNEAKTAHGVVNGSKQWGDTVGSWFKK